MPGIIVGVDGSGHSRRALEWAMKEAALRHEALNVITVHQAVKGYYGTAVVNPEDRALIEQARKAAQAEADKVLAELGESRPEAVTVTLLPDGTGLSSSSLRRATSCSPSPAVEKNPPLSGSPNSSTARSASSAALRR